MKRITSHRDGHGLNDAIDVRAIDELGPGGAHHHYLFEIDGKVAGELRFQKGARGEATSVAGLTSASVMAALIDHLQEFQDGPFPSRETALTITKLQEALFWERHRADLRAARGVLGKEIK